MWYLKFAHELFCLRRPQESKLLVAQLGICALRFPQKKLRQWISDCPVCAHSSILSFIIGKKRFAKPHWDKKQRRLGSRFFFKVTFSGLEGLLLLPGVSGSRGSKTLVLQALDYHRPEPEVHHWRAILDDIFVENL